MDPFSFFADTSFYLLKSIAICPLVKFSFQLSYFYLFIYLFIYLFLTALGLHCCTWAFSSCSERGLPFLVVRGLLIEVASLVSELRLYAHGLW